MIAAVSASNIRDLIDPADPDNVGHPLTATRHLSSGMAARNLPSRRT
ncbi:MAG: hypothetical protein JNM03_15130 [Sphingopyxis sp.]|nr:hypothetical protein [Sphingopyxis sp.]